MADFAYTTDQRVAWERHQAVRTALDLIKAGMPEVAARLLLDSVHKQARWMSAERRVRTCFECRNYEAIEVVEFGSEDPVAHIGYCREHQEVVDSEIFAAQDCQEYRS